MIDTLHPEIIEVLQDDRPLWVFGYGSLMWDPGFAFSKRLPARVNGWHRRFSLRSTVGWGTPEVPGLSAALHPGGSVMGIAFQIEPKRIRATISTLDRREAAYVRKEVRLSLSDGEKLVGLTYVADPSNGRYISGLDRHEQLHLIRQGNGVRGKSRDYLERTVGMLDQMGSRETSAHALLRFVRQMENDK